MNLEYIAPHEIEQRSFQIILEELGDKNIPDEIRPIVLRCIHTTADFDYYENLYFSENAVSIAKKAIQNGAVIVTDTNMAKAGINQSALNRHGCEVMCFMSDPGCCRNCKAKRHNQCSNLCR